jgi:ABC-type dipeptide/oligopeptide/nickel transport system ATPase component
MAAQVPNLTRGPARAGKQAAGPKPDVLCLDNLTVYYDTPRGPVHAVEGVTFSLRAQERFGLAGESGSGKSTMALTIMRLIEPPARVVSGSIMLEDTDILAVPEVKMKEMRLAQIALVAQGSMNSLNPVLRVRDQIVDGLTDHGVKLNDRDYCRRADQRTRRRRPTPGHGDPQGCPVRDRRGGDPGRP